MRPAAPGFAGQVPCREIEALMDIVITRLAELPSGALASLVAESEQAGWRFVRRLADEWAAGANRFDRPGEGRASEPLAATGAAVSGPRIPAGSWRWPAAARRAGQTAAAWSARRRKRRFPGAHFSTPSRSRAAAAARDTGTAASRPGSTA